MYTSFFKYFSFDFAILQQYLSTIKQHGRNVKYKITVFCTSLTRFSNTAAIFVLDCATLEECLKCITLFFDIFLAILQYSSNIRTRFINMLGMLYIKLHFLHIPYSV